MSQGPPTVVMTNAERATKLREAAELIREVARSLDLTQHDCEGCKRAAYNNWDHKLKSDRIGDLPKRLEQVAGGFEGKGEE